MSTGDSGVGVGIVIGDLSGDIFNSNDGIRWARSGWIGMDPEIVWYGQRALKFLHAILTLFLKRIWTSPTTLPLGLCILEN